MVNKDSTWIGYRQNTCLNTILQIHHSKWGSWVGCAIFHVVSKDPRVSTILVNVQLWFAGQICFVVVFLSCEPKPLFGKNSMPPQDSSVMNHWTTEFRRKQHTAKKVQVNLILKKTWQRKRQLNLISWIAWIIWEKTRFSTYRIPTCFIVNDQKWIGCQLSQLKLKKSTNNCKHYL